MHINEITNLTEYRSAFKKIDALIAEGFEGNPEKEKEYRLLAVAIQEFERTQFHFPKPTTLIGMIELKMIEMKLKQRDLARVLEVKESRISEVLNGKRKINFELAVKLHKKLNINAEFILNIA